MGVDSKMKRRSWILWFAFSLIVSGIGLLFDRRITFGYLLGAVVSVIMYFQTVLHVSMVLSSEKVSKLGVFHNFMLSYILMAIPLIVAVKVNWIFNVFAVAFGILSVKISIILDSITERRKDNEDHDSV